ncbi:dynamin family protein [Marininema halotolerans]|uniref:Dynamin family protein n=1 Tax=Marininema halotolerans TaxID=1155944 RepID=A0A1I6QMB1_9BACL|nr:dynamin family protein [Marininema halotolerans]SFS53581.1 Dynamin family protein [Marininema halotolerans]
MINYLDDFNGSLHHTKEADDFEWMHLIILEEGDLPMLDTTDLQEIHRYLYLTQKLKAHGDSQRGEKMLDLAKKARSQEFVLALCGHFSAGKSTMLNALYGEELLPTSPIPTSANVVAVRKGKDRVVLTLRTGERLLYKGAYTEGELKALAKNGDEVVAVDVWRSTGNLPDKTVLLDTPGIDSTDDAHRVATESALHLADVLFYAMDYNHVQSEVNLQFVKELKQRGKRVYLVINQIDKHRDEELSFADYQRSVEKSFSDWDIHVDGYFYTSLREKDHPHNEWERLKATFSHMMKEPGEWVARSIRQEATYLIEEHISDQEHRLVRDAGTDQSTQALSNLERTVDILKQESEGIQQELNQKKSSFLRTIDEIVNNAYLFPFEMRERAKAYLETKLTDFKVGILFAKGKTEQERERRRRVFYEALCEAVDNQLDRHVREATVRFLKENGAYQDERGQAIYGADRSFQPEMLERMVKAGASLTGDYVLKYTSDLAAAIQGASQREARVWLEHFLEEIEGQLRSRFDEVNGRLYEMEERLVAQRKIAQQQEELTSYHTQLMEVLFSDVPSEKKLTEEERNALGFDDVENESGDTITASLADLISSEIPSVAESEPVSSMKEVPRDQEEKEPLVTDEPEQLVLASVQRVEAILKGVTIESLSVYRKELANKRKRATERKFTVALFGAFSAGKSSFANALMGEAILPVSPNPTTAAINRIGPPTEDHPHGEAVITFKTAETLLEDLKQIYRLFHLQIETLAEGLQGISALLNKPITHPRQKTALPFLQAVGEGYERFAERLGHTVTLPLDEWSSWVAQEDKACFVEVADLYYDCPLTQQGVTLVDTPGADSIHARHTDVAFRYIKEADAILFVTYYNHAFSRADREFLIQLGRVKDAFSMDKMFFLMNAADLAASEEEKQGVLRYIQDQLLSYGIRNPRLYPVSSLLALQEKNGQHLEQPSGMASFEDAFYRFLSSDLQTVSLHSLQEGVKRALGMMRSLHEAARQGNDEKERQREQLQSQLNAFQNLVEKVDGGAEEYALRREIEELLYYVRQRMFLRYKDVFGEIFSPGVLREDRGDIKEIFRSCILELIDFLRHDLTQELRATSLRIEGWERHRLTEQAHQFALASQQINSELLLSEEPTLSVAILEWETPFPTLSLDSFKKITNSFKGSKSFFAKDDKARIREEMKEILESAVQGYAEWANEKMYLHYQEAWRNALVNMKEQAQLEGTRWFRGLLGALTEQQDPSLLEGKVIALEKEVTEMARILHRK